MKLSERAYKPGDEAGINRLYKLITGLDRSVSEYRWEWVDTWAGQGGIWLLFDNDRKSDDRLIAQYSLIPTPMSFLGKAYMAGKTENCMSHPDYRGKGIYYPHEKKYFEEAQKRFDIFFTTTGDVAKGAVGAVRRKLGYEAFDLWVRYVTYTDAGSIKDGILKRISRKNSSLSVLENSIASVLSLAVVGVCKLFVSGTDNKNFRFYDECSVPLSEIEELWSNNKNFYGITVARTQEYLAWRINDNPYHSYTYLTYYRDEKMVGYIILYQHRDGFFRIEDIFSEKCDRTLLVKMLKMLTRHAFEVKAKGVECNTLYGNRILRGALRRSVFMHVSFSLRDLFYPHKRQKPFHVFIPGYVEF